MALPLGATAIVLAALMGVLAVERIREAILRRGGLIMRRDPAPGAYDPGRERRAENKARELLRSCVNDEEWEMYRDLGFIRVWGGLSRRPGGERGARGSKREAVAQADYAYLIYPHRPVVAYLPQTGTLLNEYCVAFPDRDAPYGSTRLPASDDVLAKWMALHADERQLIFEANMHLPGRQVDPAMVRRDLRRLARWERERLRCPRHAAAAPRAV
ncbi:MAG TPA: hypothetical protein VGP17_04160 [Solirubrobacteraceae bacterium]|nr:hypothetical protein [Solirubrobacteraceae bacterium]